MQGSNDFKNLILQLAENKNKSFSVNEFNHLFYN